jgi:hypothetical protein
MYGYEENDPDKIKPCEWLITCFFLTFAMVGLLSLKSPEKNYK